MLAKFKKEAQKNQEVATIYGVEPNIYIVSDIIILPKEEQEVKAIESSEPVQENETTRPKKNKRV